MAGIMQARQGDICRAGIMQAKQGVRNCGAGVTADACQPDGFIGSWGGQSHHLPCCKVTCLLPIASNVQEMGAAGLPADSVGHTILLMAHEKASLSSKLEGLETAGEQAVLLCKLWYMHSTCRSPALRGKAAASGLRNPSSHHPHAACCALYRSLQSGDCQAVISAYQRMKALGLERNSFTYR